MTSFVPLEKPIPVKEQKWPEGTRPLVSVWCAAYNHEQFIAQTIRSFLSQETNFPIQIIVHDDASTDQTSKIVREYSSAHPGLVTPVFQTTNINSTGSGKNLRPVFETYAEGDFVAFCDGDDYWVTSDKLQSQVEVLLRHSDVTLCYHSHIVVNKKGFPLPSPRPRERMEIFEQGDFIRGKFGDLTTASVLYRKSALEPLPVWFLDLPFGDINLYALASLRGKVAVIPGVHSAYRRHGGGAVGAYHTEKNLFEHARKKLWWMGHICRLYDTLVDEAEADLKPVCRKRAFEEHVEAAWFARMMGIPSLTKEHLSQAFQVAPAWAVRRLIFWKLWLLSCIPQIDLKRVGYFDEYAENHVRSLSALNQHVGPTG